MTELRMHKPCTSPLQGFPKWLLVAILSALVLASIVWITWAGMTGWGVR